MFLMLTDPPFYFTWSKVTDANGSVPPPWAFHTMTLAWAWKMCIFVSAVRFTKANGRTGNIISVMTEKCTYAEGPLRVDKARAEVFYEGEWSHGKREGDGRCEYEDGDVYTGPCWVEDTKDVAFGTMEYAGKGAYASHGGV